MNPEFSKKLKILSFISIIGVLVAHSYFVENNAWEINAFIQDWIGCQIVRFCIPLFFFHLRIPVFPRDKRRGGNTENTEENAYEGTLPDTSLFIMESVIFPFHYFSSAHPRHWIKNQFGFSDSASNKKYPGIISFHFLGAGRFPFVVSSIPDSFCSVLSHILCFIL